MEYRIVIATGPTAADEDVYFLDNTYWEKDALKIDEVIKKLLKLYPKAKRAKLITKERYKS